MSTSCDSSPWGGRLPLPAQIIEIKFVAKARPMQPSNSKTMTESETWGAEASWRGRAGRYQR